MKVCIPLQKHIRFILYTVKKFPKMIKWLLFMGMIPVFHRKTQNCRSTVPLLQRFVPWFWTCVQVLIQNLLFQWTREPFICLAQINVVKNAKYFIKECNFACFTIPDTLRAFDTQGVMNCDVTPTATVFFLNRPEIVPCLGVFVWRNDGSDEIGRMSSIDWYI